MRVEPDVGQHPIFVVVRIAGQYDPALQAVLQRLDDRSGDAERRKQRITATPPSLDQGSVAKSLSGKAMRHPALYCARHYSMSRPRRATSATPNGCRFGDEVSS
jgi:hypothetical protein